MVSPEQRMLFNQIFSSPSNGYGFKTIVFKEKEFKPELAPPHAAIEHFKNWGRKYVRMTYTY